MRVPSDDTTVFMLPLRMKRMSAVLLLVLVERRPVDSTSGKRTPHPGAPDRPRVATTTRAASDPGTKLEVRRRVRRHRLQRRRQDAPPQRGRPTPAEGFLLREDEMVVV